MTHKHPARAESSGYGDKDEGYFGWVRYDALSLVPEHASRVLEIGCGTGNTLAWLKANKRCTWVGGVELVHEAANKARSKLDAIYEGDVEVLDLPIEAESLDAILCLDTLEHMVDPWRVVQRMHTLLKPGGVLIVSIPNVRNFRVVLPLLLRGRWEYTDEGLLDRTHLRFFVRDTAIRLVQCSGLIVDVVRAKIPLGRKARIVNALTLSRLKPFFELQYLIRARRPGGDKSCLV